MTRSTIAQAAQSLGVSKNTLRRWESLGKIQPPRRDRNGHRFYSEEDVERIRAWMDSEVQSGEVA